MKSQLSSKHSSQGYISYNHIQSPLMPIVNSNSDFSKYQDTLQKQEFQLEQVKNENSYLQTQIQLLQEKNMFLNNNNNDLKQQVNLFEQKLKDYEIEIDKIQLYTDKTQYNKVYIQNELKQKNDLIKQLEQQIDTLQYKITNLQNNYQQERLQMKQLLLNKELDNKLLYVELNKIKENYGGDSIIINNLQNEFNDFKIQKLNEIEILQQSLNQYQLKLQQIDQTKIEEILYKYNELQQLYNKQTIEITQINNIIKNLTEEKTQLIKEKQAVEQYYLDLLQKKINQNNKNDQRDKYIKQQQDQFNNLESQNTTLILEVERLNNLLKQKLLEFEKNDKNKIYLQEIDNWKNKYHQDIQQKQYQIEILQNQLEKYILQQSKE